MIIFKEWFFYKEDLSGGEAIVLSTLAYKSLCQYGEIFDIDGSYSGETVYELLVNCCEGYIECVDFTVKELVKETKMSIRNVKYILSKLRREGYIYEGTIYCPYRVVIKGFIKLPSNTTLVGRQLVFYAMIKERCDYFNGSIDSYAKTLASTFNMSEDNVRKYISILMKKRYLYRKPNGRLAVR